MASEMLTRRGFLGGATAFCGTLFAQLKPGGSSRRGLSLASNVSDAAEILHQPDVVVAYSNLDLATPLSRTGENWTGKDIHVAIESLPVGGALAIRLASPSTPLSHLHLRWKVRNPSDLRCLGDAWERSYGNLEWRGIAPERVMPWYFLAFDGSTLRGYGVKTKPSAFCFWQLDLDGISLWADIRNGGAPLKLRQRQLEVATIVTYASHSGETLFAAARKFCECMSASSRLPVGPLYGSNDWNYAYGKNTAEGILHDADLIARVAPPTGPRPFVVIDDGWQDPRRFPDLAGLAVNIHSRQLRPGIWVRPLRAPRDAKASLLLPDARLDASRAHPTWDPTIPEAQEIILDMVRKPVSWGYEFIKHDFSTFDLLGRWGSDMGALPAAGNWHFVDDSLTTAEVTINFYRSLREAAGESTMILGCNTIGHLSAGIFESQRIGDDTSGTNWERTRRMGVNALAFRLPQHRTFFHVDPDIVALTQDVDWYYTRQWLDVVSRTGSSLFISPGRGAVGPEQVTALKQAFLLVQQSQGYAEDWLDSTAPQRWLFQSGQSRHAYYDWSGASGSFPFPV